MPRAPSSAISTGATGAPGATRATGAVLALVALGVAVGVASGAASAAFLLALDQATRFRVAHEFIIYALPFAGLALGAVYERWGAPIRGGSDLVIDTLHDRHAKLPLRMAPMVMIGTILTHLFGGSAGREGTAVQMGASLADEIAHRFRVGREIRRLLLSAGIAGGFGSVFGTPVAGAVFGLEVAGIGRTEYGAIVPAMIASVVGDLVTRALGVVHTAYPSAPLVAVTLPLLAKLALIGVAMGATAAAFVEATHHTKRFLEARIPRLAFRMFVGGCVVVAMWRWVGTSDYLGLGVPTIVRAFSDPTLPSLAFAAKLVFTAVTVSSGFLGGEVTPLFFVGATLGSVLSRLLSLPIELGAGVGIAAVFAAAANAPLALSVMAVELLGAGAFPHVFIVCVVAYLVSGHRGIYSTQRVFRRKSGAHAVEPPVALRDWRAQRGPSGTGGE